MPLRTSWVKYLDVSWIEDTDREGWRKFKSELRAALVRKYPSFASFQPCNVWLGRESLAIVENEHGWIGTAEYCGVVAVWCVPLPREWDKSANGLHNRWCVGIVNGVAEVLRKTFPGKVLRLVGHWSNGEAQYERVTQ